MESVNYSQSDTILLLRVEDLANLKALDVSFFTNDSQFYTVFKRPGKQKNVTGIHMLNITEVLTDWVSSSCILTNMLSGIQ